MAPRFPKIELKPCPFCGGIAKFDEKHFDKIGSRGWLVRIMCIGGVEKGCGASVVGYLRASKFEPITVIERWNRRCQTINKIKTIIGHFLGEHCAVFGCPLGHKNGTGNCGQGWEKMTHSECINKVYEWFKEKMEE